MAHPPLGWGPEVPSLVCMTPSPTLFQKAVNAGWGGWGEMAAFGQGAVTALWMPLHLTAFHRGGQGVVCVHVRPQEQH